MKKLLIILAILLAAGTSATAYARLGTLDVSVRDLDGKPVSKATVYAINSQHIGGRTPRFTADDKGRIVLPNLEPGTYEIHAYKESDGYPDTFFTFFGNGNNNAWQVANVIADRITQVGLTLGPKYATLRLFVSDEAGKPSGASMTFIRIDDPTRPYKRGGDLDGEVTMLVPTVPFRLTIQKNGYQPWQSKLIRLTSGQTFSVSAKLRRAR